ncbi:MAG: hypothetical protein C0476_09980 [Sphingomonas sp.]|nr:hypothetical protein [Sphingomonas sp.]
MDIKILLDFDGVLFNSAFEAYGVANLATKDLADFRQDVSFEEFLRFRAFVTDAWQFNRLYVENPLTQFDQLPLIKPDEADWAFSRRFFEARSVLMQDSNWPKVMAPYDFFFQLRPHLIAHPEKFAILSTRNVASIRETMAYFDADVIEIFGQEDIRRTGAKIGVAREQGWLEPRRNLVVYVDDMNDHLEPFEGMIHLPLHADWGYDTVSVGSLSQHQVIFILRSLLKLVEEHRG